MDEGKKLEEIFASALEDWSKQELKNGVSSIWDRIVEAISNRSDANDKSTHQPKACGKTIDKILFEAEYVLADTYVIFQNQDETKKLFEEHIEMQEFNADGFRNNPILEDEINFLREGMSKDGVSSYHLTICAAVDQNSLEAFNKARNDLSHIADLNKLAKEKANWKAYLVDGYHRISVLLEEANRDKFPIVMRVIWLRTPTAELSWQVREYADTLNRVSRAQPSFSIKSNTNPWFQIQIIESNISHIAKQFIEKEFRNTETLQVVRQKFIDNEDNRHLYTLPMGHLTLLQYCNDTTDTFTKSTSISSQLQKKLLRPELREILGKIRPEMFGIDSTTSVNSKKKLADKVGMMALFIVFMRTLGLASCDHPISGTWSKLCMRDKLWSLLERSMTKVNINGKYMHGWCLEFTPWLTLKRSTAEMISQTSLDRLYFVSMEGVTTEDDILGGRQLIEESCRQDFVAFLKMLLVLPSARHELVPILLIWRKVVLWLQGIHNCLLRGIGNFQFYCVNYATNYQSDHTEFMSGAAESFSFTESLPTIVDTIGNFFCERLFTSEGRSFASDSEKVQSIRFLDCPLFPVADTELGAWRFELNNLDQLCDFIDEAYDDLDSFQHSEDGGTWDTIKQFWQKHYLSLYKELRDMIKIPDKRDENRSALEEDRSSGDLDGEAEAPVENRSSTLSQNGDCSFEVSSVQSQKDSEKDSDVGEEENDVQSMPEKENTRKRKRRRKHRRFSAIQIERQARTLEDKLAEEVVKELEKEFGNVALEGDQLKRVGSRIVDLLVNNVTSVFRDNFVPDDDDNASHSSNSE